MHGDITSSAADAIVNAANPSLLHGGGVAGAIVRKGGKIIQQESSAWVRKHGPAGPGHPAMTGAGDLPARVIIHAVGPVWGEGNEDLKLQTAIMASLETAESHSLTSIALPAISTGIFRFPKARAARIILGAIETFVSGHPNSSLHDIRIVIIDQPTLDVFLDAFKQRWPEGPETT